MGSKIVRLPVAASVTVAGLLAVAVPATAAESPVSAGWWSAAPFAPDAPEDGIVVQGGPDPNSPVSYGAVAFELAPGETPVTLRVAIAPDTASMPATLAACPLVDPFTPAQGGSMDEAPAFDCGARVTAAPSGDGSTYEFDLRTLGRTDVASLALLPTTATDRVVLAAPAPDALTTESSGSAVTPDPAASFDASPAPATADTPATSATFDIPLPLAPMVSDEAPATSPAAAAPSPTRLAAAPALASQPVAGGDGSSKLPAFAFAGLSLAAVVLWASAGRSRDDQVGGLAVE